MKSREDGNSTRANIKQVLGRLELYLDHLDMDLSEYLSQDNTTEMDVCVSKRIVSPKKEGLMEVVTDVLPNAEHRQCARHIYENFRKQYPGLEFRQLFWAASKASYPQLFNKIMDKIKIANPNAHKYLMDNNPKACQEPFLRFWHVIHASGNLFEMRSGSEGFIVDEGNRTCNCRMCRLSGIPCVHATNVIFLIHKVPKSYVPAWFETDMYFVAYHNFVKPVPSMNFWPDQSMYSTVLPPKPRKMPGSQASCPNYKKPGHNKASCTEPVVEQTPKPKGVPGRPRKKQSVGDVEDVDVVLRGPVRDEGVGGSRGGAS
nr:multidrug resistance-associated protein 5 [Tanacetum cinerariifolium]